MPEKRDNSDEEYLPLFYEIADGYSRFDLELNGKIFIRHPTFRDFLQFQQSLEHYKSRAKKRGMMTNEEASKLLVENGDWDAAKDERVEELRKEIELLDETIGSLLLPSEVEALRRDIEAKRAEMMGIVQEKSQLMGLTVETFADGKVNEEFVSRAVYVDEGLQKLLIPHDQMFKLPRAELSELISAYVDFRIRFDDVRLQKMALQGFARQYWPLAEDYYHFYGKLAINLTLNQMRTLSYFTLFKNIFENNDDIPARMHNDPQAIFDFIRSKREGRKQANKSKVADNSSTSVGTTYFGATKEDMETLTQGESTVDLHEELMKRGGSMGPQEFFEFMQQNK